MPRPLIEQMSVFYATQIEELAEQNRQLREMLEWLNRRGGLGLDVHERIRKLLEEQKHGD